MVRKAARLFLVLTLLAAGCTSFKEMQGLPLPPATASPTAGADGGLTPAPTEKPTPESPLTLRVWVPPQFDPSAETVEGSLLRNRLNEFLVKYPGLHLEVRIKSQDGPGGLLDSLSSASAAAPDALPDLVALPRPIMEAAALKGLLHPYDGLSSAMDGSAMNGSSQADSQTRSDWYDYAQELARIQNSTFGIPFAGDALILIYHPSVVGDPPRDMETAIYAKGPLAFPAADPQALYTLTLYQSTGAPIQTDQGRPTLDANALSEVLTYYKQGRESGLTPFWLTQFEADNQSWTAFIENRANLVVTWASRYLGQASQMPPDTAAAPLPTLKGTPYTFATGWVWALGSSQPEKQKLAASLAEFLTEGQFLARWTAAAGLLPTRASALAAWPATPLQSLSSQIVLSAHLYPSAEILSSLSPLLRQATMELLNSQGEPLPLAQEAADKLKNR